MNNKEETTLYEKYPLLFPKPLAFGFECSSGWFKLIDKLCKDITGVLESATNLPPEYKTIEVRQVKEKYSSLRFYIGQVHESIADEIFALINKAEDDSSCICEECGEKGETKTIKGWMRTLCDNCSKERN